MRTFIMIVCLFLGSSVSRAIVPPHGKLFEIGSEKKKFLFDWQRTEEKEGDKTVRTSIFKDEKGVAVKEVLVLKGKKLEKYSIDQNQLGAKGSVTVRGEKVFFEYTSGGTTRTSEENLVSNFVVSSTLIEYLDAHRAELNRGEDVEVRLGVPDRRETVGFKIFKEEEKMDSGRKLIVLKMKPSSFVISMVVDPIFLTLEKESFKLERVVGRALPKLRVGDRFRDLNAEFYYF